MQGLSDTYCTEWMGPRVPVFLVLQRWLNERDRQSQEYRRQELRSTYRHMSLNEGVPKTTSFRRRLMRTLRNRFGDYLPTGEPWPQQSDVAVRADRLISEAQPMDTLRAGQRQHRPLC